MSEAMTAEMQQRTGKAGATGGDDGQLSARTQEDLPLGAHLVTIRRGYLHHGIYVGAGRVVHYAGLSRSWHRGPIEDVSLEYFAAGRPILVKSRRNARYHGMEVVERARSRLGEDRYRITSNNCEHFCEWCIDGTPRSAQVDNLMHWPLFAALRRHPLFVRLLAADPIA